MALYLDLIIILHHRSIFLLICILGLSVTLEAQNDTEIILGKKNYSDEINSIEFVKSFANSGEISKNDFFDLNHITKVIIERNCSDKFLPVKKSSGLPFGKIIILYDSSSNAEKDFKKLILETK